MSMGDRMVKAMPPVFVALIVAGVIRRAVGPINDTDSWWHLRLGTDLLRQHSLAAPPWGRFATRSWTPSEPLPEIVAAKMDQWFGLPGVAWLFGASLAVIVGLMYVTNRLRGDVLAATIATIFGVTAASGSLTSRPQLVSFAFLMLVLMAWFATERDLKPRWWLIPLTWFWSLCHGFWFFGVAFSGLCWLGLVLDRRVTPREAARLAIVPVASFAVVLLNPAGPGVLTAPFAVSDTKGYISEWQHATLEAWAVAAALMVLVVAAIYVRKRRFSWLRILLLVAAAFLTWYARRTIAIAGVVTAPLLAEALQSIVAPAPVTTGEHSLETKPWRPGRREVLALIGWCVACLAVLAVAVPSTSDTADDVPLGLDHDLDALPAGTVVYNNYEVGSWLAWRHPDLTRVIDGLVVPYPNDFVQRYFISLGAGTGWQQTVASTDATYALLKEDGDLTKALEGAGWTSVGTDDDYVLLVKPVVVHA